MGHLKFLSDQIFQNVKYGIDIDISVCLHALKLYHHGCVLVFTPFLNFYRDKSFVCNFAILEHSSFEWKEYYIIVTTSGIVCFDH